MLAVFLRDATPDSLPENGPTATYPTAIAATPQQASHNVEERFLAAVLVAENPLICAQAINTRPCVRHGLPKFPWVSIRQFYQYANTAYKIKAQSISFPLQKEMYALHWTTS